MKPKVNRRLFHRVIAAIKREPRAFHMDTFGERETPGVDRSQRLIEQAPPCGTVACIAGHALLIAGKAKFDRYGDLHTNGPWPWDEWAAEALGLTLDQAGGLFYWTEWPVRFSERYNAAKTPRGRAAVAVARIEHFLRTGE